MLITVTPSCLLYTTSSFFDLSLIGIITKSLYYLIYQKMYQKEGLLLILYKIHASTFKGFPKPKLIFSMKELYREIKINKPGLRFLPKLSLSVLAEVVYFYLLI